VYCIYLSACCYCYRISIFKWQQTVAGAYLNINSQSIGNVKQIRKTPLFSIRSAFRIVHKSINQVDSSRIISS
jgi:hypothetical protein